MVPGFVRLGKRLCANHAVYHLNAVTRCNMSALYINNHLRLLKNICFQMNIPLHKSIRFVLLVLFVATSQLTATDYFVHNTSEINNALPQLQPGDTVTMANGLWSSVTIVFEGEGTETNPITLRAQTPGQVVISGNSKLQIGGSWMVVDGLRFLDGTTTDSHVIRFRTSGKGSAKHCRLTNTSIENYSPENDGDEFKWVSLYGQYNRVDHCFFSGKTNEGALLVVWGDAEPDYHLIDNNYFGNRPPLGRNGAEIIRVGTSEWSMHDSKTIVEWNYFERCNGEIEIISNKMGDNVFRHNTFFDNAGMLTLRHGNRSQIYGNFFFGNQNSQAGGVRIIGEDHKVYNNYFQDLHGSEWRSAITFMNGVPDSPLNRYFQVKRALVAFNTFVDCKSAIAIGAGVDSELTLPPLDCTIANNALISEGETVITQFDTPINLEWQGNIMFGAALGIEQPAGINWTDPKLAIAVDSIWRPLPDSPVIGAALGEYDVITEDFDGHPRTQPFDVGADEVSSDPVVYTPLTAEHVGPNWESVVLPNVLSVTIEGRGSVKLNPPGGLYEDSTEVTLTAVPADSSTWFSKWTGDVSSTENPLTLLITEDVSVTAVFESLPEYNILTWITGQGSVLFDPPGETWVQGTIVKVTAKPAAGWKFDSWKSPFADSAATMHITMDTNKLLQPVFVEDAGGGSHGVLEIDDTDDLGEAVQSAYAQGLDTLMLTTSGGVYTTNDTLGVIISQPLTILAAPNLDKKPILINSDPNQKNIEILRVYDDLIVEGIVFDGGHDLSHGMKYAIRVQPDDSGLTPRRGVNITLKDCDFKDFYQDKNPDGDGHALRFGTGAVGGTVRIENCTFTNFGYEAIRISDTEKFNTDRAVDSLIVRNCTFVNIDAECIRFYADENSATPDAYVLMEHLTIYHSATRVAYIKNNENTIFRNIIIAKSRTSGHSRDGDLFEVQSPGSVSSHIDTFQVKAVDMKAPKGGTVLENTIYGYDPMFADPQNGDFTLDTNSPVLNLAHDGSALGDLRWAGNSTVVFEETPAMPTGFALEQNYPNPFNPTTTIRFVLPEGAHVKLQIFNVLWQHIATLVDGQRNAGNHTVMWDAADVASGIYFYRLQIDDGKMASKKMMLLR
ncbi:MAG: DUF5123 domain-containing protein [Calditrichaeota bacterium]|nr:MAG: DUF5123 domain-containing protein [Calditrichota bacterium]